MVNFEFKGAVWSDHNKLKSGVVNMPRLGHLQLNVLKFVSLTFYHSTRFQAVIYICTDSVFVDFGLFKLELGLYVQCKLFTKEFGYSIDFFCIKWL